MTQPKRHCRVCEHPSRSAIDQAILNGKALRAIARDFSIGSNPGTDQFKADHKIVTTHRDACMGAAYQAAKDADLEASGLALVNRLIQMDEVVDEVVQRNRDGYPILVDGVPLLNEDGSPMKRYHDATLLKAVAEARRNTEVRARLAGALPDGDPDDLARTRAALGNPAARRLIAELDTVLGADDQELPA